MNSNKILLIGFIICSLMVISLACSVQPFTAKASSMKNTNSFSSFDSDWHAVNKLENEGKTKDAKLRVEGILAKAKAEKNASQRVKCLLHLFKYNQQTEENSSLSIVQQMQAEIREASQPSEAVLKMLLANMYLQYFNSDRYRILERSTVAGEKNEDFRMWDAKTFASEIKDLFLSALSAKSELQKKPISEFQDILSSLENSSQLRPSLYDFVAQEAINFFRNEANNITNAKDQFRLTNEAGLGTTQQFIEAKIENDDPLSFTFYALETYQQLAEFHNKKGNTESLVDVELDRLEFARSIARMDSKDELYLETLNSLLKKYKKDPVSTRLQYKIANHYYQKPGKQNPDTGELTNENKKIALKICEEAISSFPNSFGGKNCTALKSAILQRNLSFQIENCQIPEKDILLSLSYRNLKNAFVRVIKVTDDVQSKVDKFENEYDNKLFNYLRELPAAYSKTQNLIEVGDYEQHITELKIPSFDLGKYLVLIASSDDFKYDKEGIAWQYFRVTNLSYFANNLTSSNEGGIYVRNRETSEAIEGVNVKFFRQKYNYDKGDYDLTLLEERTTDEKGYVKCLDGNESGRAVLHLSYKNDFFSSEGLRRSYKKNSEKTSQKLFLFSDRSLYRPGQTVYFKGILFEGKNNDYKVIKGVGNNVEFLDVNRQLVSSIVLTTNEYGSFQGSFTIPQNGLTGRMRIKCGSNKLNIQVEEYKRPKFEVKLNPLKGSYKLNQDLEVSGEAKSYSGAPIDGAIVKYRVVRTTSYPYWRYYWRPVSQNNQQEISNGQVKSDEKGEYKIPFKAIPDLSVDPKTKPQFNYTVYVDVIDLNGETRSSSQNVSVAYTSLKASVAVMEQIDRNADNQFPISTVNYSNQHEDSEVEIKLIELKSPERYFREQFFQSPDQFLLNKNEFHSSFPQDAYGSENTPQFWERGKEVFKTSLTTQKDSKLLIPELKTLATGYYLLKLETKDKYGEKVEWEKVVILFDFADDKVSKPTFFDSSLSSTSAEPGEEVSLSISSSASDFEVLVQVLNKTELIQEEWIKLNNNQRQIKIKIKEEWRGNIGFQVTGIRHSRYLNKSHVLSIPWSNKELELETSTFRNKLYPGQEEEWSITIKGPKGDAIAAELLTGMYDASLDAFKSPPRWNQNLYHSSNHFYQNYSDSKFGIINSNFKSNNWHLQSYPKSLNYYYLNWFGFNLTDYTHFYNQRAFSHDMNGDVRYESRALSGSKSAGRPRKKSADLAGAAPMMAESASMDEEAAAIGNMDSVSIPDDITYTSGKSMPKEKPVQIRKNLQETAFFLPQLSTNKKGEVVFKFTMPEALTKWKLMAFAHTKDMKMGYLEEEAITQKDLMVTPNAPRFLRDGDDFNFAAKISNLSSKDLNGTAELQLLDPKTMKPVDKLLGNKTKEISFSVKAGQSTAVKWPLEINDDISAVIYRVIAKAGAFSDGEENMLPILSNRMLVTESLPLWQNGKGKREFNFEKLEASGKSSTLKNHQLTLEYSPQPAWYAVQALPYLMEFPHECTEQIYSRFYANSLASYIGNSSDKIKKVFDSWTEEAKNGGEALLSNLEKNQELKAVLLQETPWVLDAQNESERKQRLGILFDRDRIAKEQKTSLDELNKRQSSNGAWPWFPGMPENRYITQLIISGIGHLNQLGLKEQLNSPEVNQMIEKAITYLDIRIAEDYNRLLKSKVKLKDNHLNHTFIHYLYTRSFFKEIPIPQNAKTAFDYFLGQTKSYWLNQSIYSKGMIALARHRFGNGDDKTAFTIIEALKQNTVSNEEMGLYFKENRGGYYWHQAPIETQALIIEAFHEVTNDQESINGLKTWLLKQKQTQDWKTTKATAEAIYALLLQGDDWLHSEAAQEVEISLGGKIIKPVEREDKLAEAGTGYIKTTWSEKEIKPEMGQVSISQKHDGPSWGALYWQYFEQLDKISTAETPLAIKKELFVETISDNGKTLVALDGKKNKGLKVGDKAIVRVEIVVDRDMEYVHLKDMRAAGFEPIDVISKYKYQDGLGYYQSTKDAATHFFMGYLPKGTYVFEYALRATLAGEFSNGITSMQCMYAPEFSSHSEGIRIKIED